MSVLEELSSVATQIQNPYLEDWTNQGKKVVGYFCTYIPEELIIAAGALPFRMRAIGSTQTTLGDSYLSYYNCSFTRHCLDLAFRGEFNFLEGIVGQPSCDHVRRIYDVWKAKIDTPFIHFVKVPRKNTGGAKEWYKTEIVKMKEALESHFGIQLTNDRLREGIKACNETRRLLKSLYELRKADHPPVTGAETLSLVIASTAMPKDRFNQKMEQVLEEVKTRDGTDGYKARLLVASPILDNPNYLKVMEDAGGLVMADYLCFGTRAIWNLVDESIDPMEAIAQRYMERLSCPRMMGDYDRRLEFIKDSINEYHIDGVVCTRLTFCELWGGENYMLREDMKKLDVPALVLEREHKLDSVGQLKTRIQAFLEILEK
ncbi:MAG: 2-hydroxyacyl-CoA dehydratase subunit D [Candidatus Binatia bacterium]